MSDFAQRLDDEYIEYWTSVIRCEKHGTVSPDYCAQCRIRERAS